MAPVRKTVYYAFVLPCLLYCCASCAPIGWVGLSGEDIDFFAPAAEPFLGRVSFGPKGTRDLARIFSPIFVHPQKGHAAFHLRPCFGGTGESFSNCAEQVELSGFRPDFPYGNGRARRLHGGRGGGDVQTVSNGVTKISESMRDYLAPEAADSVYQEVVRFFLAIQTMDDLFRRKAKSKMQMGGVSPGILASALCVPKNRWPPSMYEGTWKFLLLPDRCVANLDRAAALLDRMFRRRQMWMRPRMKMIISLLG